MQPIMNAPTGGMNKDLDPLYLNNQKYRDARNVRPVSDAGGSTMSMETIKGTREEFDVGTVSAQDKKIEIEITDDTSSDRQLFIEVLDKSGNKILGELPIVFSPNHLAPVIANKLDNVSNVTANALSNQKVEVTIENGKEYTIDVFVFGYPPPFASTNASIDAITTTQEQRSGLDETGKLYLIGQHEYHDKLFLFFTTSTTENGGTGEIGVVTENTDGTLTYLRGLRSKELKFSTQYPIEAVAEETDFRVAVYFTDNFNELRKFAYDAPVSVSDFGLVLNGGRYDLGFITKQVRLIPVPPITQIRFNTTQGEGGQIQTGGALKAGTYRYAVRFLTQELEETTWTTLTNQMPVFSHSLIDNPRDLLGSPTNEDTGKINVVKVTGIDDTTFAFIELGVVRYVGSTPTGSVVKRLPITGPTMEISHTGNEQNTQALGNLAQFSLEEVGIDKAKNIGILDNRFFVSNITFKTDQLSTKLQNVADKISVSWNTFELDGLGIEQNRNAEYMLPNNCAERVGYASGETYRFGIRFRFINGSFSKPFHVTDTAPPLQGPLTNQSTSGTNNPLINYPVFSNIDLSDNEVNQEVIGYQIMRVEMDGSTQEMLFSGIATPCFQVRPKTGLPSLSPEPYWPAHPAIVRSPSAWQFPNQTDTWVITSPDIFYGSLNFDRGRDGDEVYVVYGKDYNVQNGGSAIANQFYEYDGSSQIEQAFQVRDADTINGGAVTRDLTKFTPGAALNDGSAQRNVEPLIAPSTSAPLSLVSYPRIVNSAAVFLDGKLTAVNAVSFTNELYILPVMYYKRPKTDKFGRKENSLYVPCQQVQQVTQTVENTSCFGGDTFTQKSIIHQWFETGEADPNTTSNNQSVITSFYSENRVNSQLRLAVEDKDLKSIYPQGGQTLSKVLEEKLGVNNSYNDSYRYHNSVQVYSAYNSDVEEVSQSETRIYFSLLNPTNSRADRYGQFKPLNFKDLDPNNGPINHMAVVNGFLHTWQPRAFSRLYVNMTGLINPEDSTSVVTGSNEVLQKKEKKLSTYGTNHKWSVVVGRSQGGNDVAFWYSSEFNKMLRFGYDGTVPISDRDGMQAYFANEFKGLRSYDAPTHIGGVHGVWNERFKEMLMTFIVPKDSVNYDDGIEMQNAGYLTSTTTNNQTTWFLQIPGDALIRKNGRFYEPKSYIEVFDVYPFSSRILKANDPTFTSLKWNELTLQDEKAFKTDTIVHSNLFDAFTAFYDHPTRIYAPINDGIISQNSEDLTIHKHDVGEYCEFYNVAYDASVQMPINDRPNIPKVYQAIAVKSEDKPFRVEFETKEHESFLTNFDFEEREGTYMAPIKLDSSLDGINDNNSENLRGSYLLTRVLFEPKKYNNLFNFVVRTVESFRNIKA